MATRTTYHCPHCGAEINSQGLLPPVNYTHACAACGNTVHRTGASIRDAWQTFLLIAGALPLYALAFYVMAMSAPKSATWGTVAMVSFFVVFPFGLGALMIVGWVIGLFVSAFAPRRA